MRDPTFRPTTQEVLIRSDAVQESLQRRFKLPMLEAAAQKATFSVSADAQAELHTQAQLDPGELHPASLQRVSKVCDGLFIGSYTHTADTLLLRRLGISHVVLCDDPEERPEPGPDPESLHLEVMALPPLAAGPQLASYFERVVRDIHAAVQGSIDGAVLVASKEGKSRAPALAIAYLMASKGVSAFEGFIQVRTCRPAASPRHTTNDNHNHNPYCIQVRTCRPCPTCTPAPHSGEDLPPRRIPTPGAGTGAEGMGTVRGSPDAELASASHH